MISITDIAFGVIVVITIVALIGLVIFGFRIMFGKL